jgi:metal-responsive CopG/Arc/MetJ family transcriptional regulator
MKFDAQEHHQRTRLAPRLDTPLALAFPRPLVDAIDAIVADRVDGPSRSAVIRELLAEAVEARRGKTGNARAV